MRGLKYFLSGVVTRLLFFGLVENLFEVILLWLETLAIKPTNKILKFQSDSAILREFIKQPEEQGDYEVEYIDEDDD